jgi:hypothetical protein
MDFPEEPEKGSFFISAERLLLFEKSFSHRIDNQANSCV